MHATANGVQVLTRPNSETGSTLVAWLDFSGQVLWSQELFGLEGLTYDVAENWGEAYQLSYGASWREVDADHVVFDLTGGLEPLEISGAGFGPLRDCNAMAVAAGYTICESAAGALEGRDAAGNVLWTKDRGYVVKQDDVNTTPLFFSTREGDDEKFWTIDQTTGQPVESSVTLSRIYSIRISGSDELPVLESEGVLHGLSEDLTQELWSFDLGGAQYGRAWHLGDRVVYSAYLDGVYVLDAETGELIEQFAPRSEVMGLTEHGIIGNNIQAIYLAELP